jgi:hypothetical protein
VKQICSERDRLELVRDVMNLALPFRVDLRSGARSLDQNSLSFVWYGVIGKRDPEFDTVEARRFAKLHFGVPIMRAGSEEFRGAWDRMAMRRFTYPEKLELMDWWPVTSLMDKAQMREYLTAMQAHWIGRGVILSGLDEHYGQYPEAAR